MTQASSNGPLLYVGTYTGPASKGIYLYQFDAGRGTLVPLGVAGETTNPSFLTIDAPRRFLYAVNEVRDGTVTAFSIDRNTGRLTLLNQQPTGGADPCHLAIDRSGRHLLAANYSGGSVAVFPILADGRIGERSCFIQHQGSSVHPRQAGPHAHGVYLDAANRFAFAPDLGQDKLMVYRLAADAGTLAPNDPAHFAARPGAGPRHLAFAPRGDAAYLINELDSTIDVLTYDAARGTFATMQTVSTLPPDFRGQTTTAEIEVHPSGRFLYASNRGHDSIAFFTIDAAGRLNLLQHAPSGGKEPRHFAIDPSGQWLLAANQRSDNLVMFRIDQTTGRLTPAGEPTSAPSPVCVQWLAQAG